MFADCHQEGILRFLKYEKLKRRSSNFSRHMRLGTVLVIVLFGSSSTIRDFPGKFRRVNLAFERN